MDDLSNKLDNLISYMTAGSRRRRHAHCSPHDISAFNDAEPRIESLEGLVETTSADEEIAADRAIYETVGHVSYAWLHDESTQKFAFARRGSRCLFKTYEEAFDVEDASQHGDIIPSISERFFRIAQADVAFNMMRVKQVPISACRGRAPRIHSKMFETTFGVMTKAGEYDLISILGGPSGLSAMAAAACLARRYDWRVSVGFEGCASVSFVTDPVGAREMFCLRDIPNGAARRAALLHWVSEHWRKKRSDPSEEAKVRAHLRGASAFTWNGMRCRISPSAFDAERAAVA